VGKKRWIFVLKFKTFFLRWYFTQVGTEAEPFQSNAQIVMFGNLRSPELPIYGAKTLGVRNGTLDLHGRHILHTWTKLAQTAAASATKVRAYVSD